MSLTFISAGAGSGKTYTLTQTLGQLLDSGQVRHSGVIATTFTKKAATELRERARQHLLDAGKFALASAMGQARIGTVNSVCGGLLERFAFEAGLATQQQVLEETQAGLLIREAIDVALNGQQVAALSRLAGRLGIEDWADILKGLVAQVRSNDMDTVDLPGFAKLNADNLLKNFPKPVAGDMSQELLHAIDGIFPALRIAVAESTKDNTKKYLTALENFRQKLAGGNASWGEWIGMSKILPEKALQQPFAEAIQLQLQRCSSHPQLHTDIREYLGMMFDLCANVLVHYQARKRDLGVVDFADQEHLLLKLLDHPEVSSVLRDELDLLLVDEFQDTSPIQLALFLKLSRLAKKTYWVGDIKQAIYGFRGSDTALMQSILQSLGSLGGNKTVLDTSWRSRPGLVNLVNHVFTPAFSATLPTAEVELKAQRSELLEDAAFANWMLAGNNVETRTAALAQGVKKLLSSGYKIPDKESGKARRLHARDIAILSRSNDGVALIAKNLRGIGIPVATSQPGLLATPEATLALACLRRLNDSSDTIATAEILSLADSEAPEDWLADRLSYLAQKGERSLWREAGDNAHPLLAYLASLRSELPLLAPGEALQRIIADGDLPRRVLRWRQDPAVARTRLANLEALLALAVQYEDSCRSTRQAATISGLILWLMEQAEAGADALAEPAVDAVRVMTHHAAKGLEWPVVILTDLEKKIRDRLWGISSVSPPGAINATNPLKDRFLYYWPWPFGLHTTGIDVADTIAQSAHAKVFQDAAVEEAKRLLYVSMTRPRELLVFARNGKAKSNPWLDTLGADCLLPEDASTTEIKVGRGKTVPYKTWDLEAPAEMARPLANPKPVHWFPELNPSSRLPLFFNPSCAAKKEAHSTEQVRIGNRISVGSGADWSVLGSALHACIALSFTDPAVPLEEAEIRRLLEAFAVDNLLTAPSVLTQIQAFHLWINTRWPGCKVLAEIPVGARLQSCQILNGRIDLLLDTDAGYVLIDHKSSPLAQEQWDSLAEDYAGQLSAYATAIEQASGRKVIEQWLFLPVAGGGVRVEFLDETCVKN